MTEEHSLETLSIVIPVFNEVNSLKEIIQRVREVQLPQIASREIVIVDDYSSDGTRDVLATYKDQNAFKIVFHDRNRGKGAALRTGIAETTGSIVIIQDADLEYDPQEYPKHLAPLLAGKADVVYGSRFAGGESKRVLYFWHSVGNRFLTTFSNMFTNINLTDMETCYKVFRGEVIQSIRIEEDRFGFEPEVTSKVARIGCRIYEVGIGYSGRTTPKGRRSTGRTGSELSGASSSIAEGGNRAPLIMLHTARRRETENHRQ